jgi:hypothetical protein
MDENLKPVLNEIRSILQNAAKRQHNATEWDDDADFDEKPIMDQVLDKIGDVVKNYGESRYNAGYDNLSNAIKTVLMEQK